MSDFLKYWDTRIIRNQRVFDAHPQIANFAYCECEKIWDHMEAENKALLARHNTLAEAVAWEMEFDEALVWLVQTGRYPRDMAGKYDLVNERECARAEVDRLIGGE